MLLCFRHQSGGTEQSYCCPFVGLYHHLAKRCFTELWLPLNANRKLHTEVERNSVSVSIKAPKQAKRSLTLRNVGRQYLEKQATESHYYTS